MPSFGEKLRLERDKRKITLEEISSSTKIGTRMLQALEEDKFDQLPGGIFNKGFVRAYCHVLGLDEDQVVAEYLQASGDAAPPRTEIASREDQTREDDARQNEEHIRRLEAIGDDPPRRVPWGWFAALLLVVALALSVWTRHQREQARQSLLPAPAAPAIQTPGDFVANPNPAGAGSGSGASTAASGTTESRTADSGTSNSVTTDSSRRDSGAAAAVPGEFTVVVHVREDSWISVTVDGKVVLSEVLISGSERTLRGKKEIVIKAGNAGGVDFRFNGNKVDTGAGYGEVKMLTFGPGGMTANASAPPSTP